MWKKIALAPIYLGTLYHGLDALVNAVKATNGKEKLSTSVDLAFLQMLVWERFKRISPIRKQISQVYEPSDYDVELFGEEAARTWSWTHSRYTGTEILTSFIDDLSKFMFRPYLFAPQGFFTLELYSGGVALLSKDRSTLSSCPGENGFGLPCACLVHCFSF